MPNRLVLAGLLAVLAIGPTARAAPFTNGSFEAGSVNPGGGFVPLGGGSGAVTGWTTGGGGIDYIGGYWQPSNGSRSVDLSNLSAGSIFQTFDTVAGQLYTVTFDMAGNTDGGALIKDMTVQATGGLLANFSFDRTGKTHANMGWISLSYSFVATGSSTTLTFTSLENNPYGPALDNVAVTAVPEPASLALFGLAGLVGAGVAYRRRKAPRA